MINAHICDKICYLALTALLHYRLEWFIC